MKYRCDSCGYTDDEDKFDLADDLLERLEPGGIFTSSECPECGALAYPFGTGYSPVPFINDIDWGLLKQQKSVLLELVSRLHDKLGVAPALDGLIHLLDALQDYAVDKLGIDEGLVMMREVYNSVDNSESPDPPQVVNEEPHATSKR